MMTCAMIFSVVEIIFVQVLLGIVKDGVWWRV